MVPGSQDAKKLYGQKDRPPPDHMAMSLCRHLAMSPRCHTNIRSCDQLPVVLSGAEIARFLEAVPGLRSRAALTTAYGAGLRVSEVAAL